MTGQRGTYRNLVDVTRIDRFYVKIDVKDSFGDLSAGTDIAIDGSDTTKFNYEGDTGKFGIGSSQAEFDEMLNTNLFISLEGAYMDRNITYTWVDEFTFTIDLDVYKQRYISIYYEKLRK